MQITIKSTKVIKEGERKDGTPYKWCSVMAEDGSEKGTEYTTFDSGILRQNPSAVIDIGEPEIKAGKCSFKKIVSVISEASIAHQPPGNNGNQMSKEEWAEKDRVKRQSIERQSAAELAVQLSEKTEPLDAVLAKAERIYSWIHGEKTAPDTSTTKKKQESQNPPKNEPEEEFSPEETTGMTKEELFARVTKLQGWTTDRYARTWIVNQCGIKESRIDSEPEKVWQEIQQKFRQG